MPELPLGQRVFLFCSRLRPAPNQAEELAQLQAELEASELTAEEREKLLRMLRAHAERLS